jgi:hypothetical protein
MERVCPCSKFDLLSIKTSSFLAPSIFAEFLLALMDFVSDFFIEIQRVRRHFPENAFPQPNSLVDTSPIPNNVCFTAVLSRKS